MLITVCMVMAVDILLLSASGRLVGVSLRYLRILLGAMVGGILAGMSLLPGLEFCTHILWQVGSLLITALIAYGFRGPSVSAILIFLLLHLSLGNLTGDRKEMISTILGAVGIALACSLVKKRSQLVDVSLTYHGKTLRFTALRDTGNELRDPVTGEGVLVVSESIAHQLTGLPEAALADPVNSIAMLPGLRLIPYQTVGNTGFLLAMRIPEARIGNRQGSVVVAFSPHNLGHHYQGLTGGMLG